ncbi:MAG: DNA translocase FtsK, partial [Chloroflexia bacterium]
GLGAKRRHNLTVSSSYRARDIVVSRLTANLEALLPGTPDAFRREVAQRLVAQAKQVSGDIVLRAAGPGAYLNELIGMVVAKHETERRYLAQHPGALTAWIYLDDFAHWFDGRIPDLLFVAIPPEANGKLPLHVELLETKCVGESNFAVEAADAQKQVAQGVNRLAQAWAPGAQHLDAPYWYDQLYRAVVGNLALERDQMRLWEAFRRRLPQGDFTLEISGHTWVFCHDSSLGIAGPSDEGEAAVVAPHVPHRYHHFGRAGLRRLLRGLVEAWELPAPAETWAAAHDAPPQPTAPEPPLSPPPAAPRAAEPPAPPTLEAEGAPPSKPLAEWREQQARNLARALRDYGIQVYPIQPDEADVGPGVVRFKVRLRPGEKLSRLQAIAADLQRELALTAPPLIDNVRGTNFVGIDLPHPQPEILPLLPALSQLPSAPVGRLPFLVGQTPAGQVITADLADLPHLLVAGSTGSGKTIFLYSLLLSLIHNHSPQTLALLVIDPKQTDFIYFEGLPHLLGGQVVIDPRTAIAWLDQLTTETLEARTQQLRAARCRDIHDYNAQHPDAPLAPLVVVIDEYADLVQVLDRAGRQEFERRLVRLAQRARNVGIHLVIATQRPSADIVTTSLKANLPARIAFRLPSHHDSMTILDQAGAENLLGRGDMLFVLSSGSSERLQGFYVSPDDLERYLTRHKTTA